MIRDHHVLTLSRVTFEDRFDCTLIYTAVHRQTYLISLLFFMTCYCISGEMVSVLASSAVDRGFEPRLSQSKDYELGICCFSAKHSALRIKNAD